MTAIPGVTAATISQGYPSDETLTPGTLVAAKDGNGKAVAADQSNSDGLLGVAVETKGAAVAVENSSDKLQVGTSGTARAFVSDLGGAIKAGDPIATSPIRGVGMKALGAGKIIGSAEADAVYGGQTVAVKATDGKVTQAKLGTVTVNLQVAYFAPPPEKTLVPPFLQVFANSLAGKPVSFVRLVISAMLVLIATVAVGMLLFSAVRTTMVSIGRNPLAQSSIYRSLWQVLFTSGVVFGAAIGASYLVLTG